MELVVVKVRPCYQDKKSHTLRFLFPDGEFNLDLVNNKLHSLFPYGFFNPEIDRYLIDYAYSLDNHELVSLCNHDYLAQYLTSTEKK